MVRDTRCDEVRNNPVKIIPEYFAKGWLGGATLKNAVSNARIYKKSSGRMRKMLDDGEMSDIDYVLAVEQAFLYGKAGRRVIFNSAKLYFDAKLHHRPIADYSSKLIEFSGEPDDNDYDKVEITEEIHAEENFLEKVKKFDKDHVWMFDAGNNGRSDFRGNPKYLFIYINKYRPDIFAYWYVEENADKVVKQVKKLGCVGVLQGTSEANTLLNYTGVVVSEMVREYIPAPLVNAKYLNLWHGIGFKRIERSIQNDLSDLRLGIAKKYIIDNSFYLNNQLVCVSSPLYEQEFVEDLGIGTNQLVKTGYLRCMYQSKYEPIQTYDHSIINRIANNDNTRIAVYAPTYRAQRGDAFVVGMANLDRLYKCCVDNNILLIFKPHQYIENEKGFIAASKKYKAYSNFLFWDNTNDFYEILDKVDLVIYDYSSIFSDFLCAGVKHFIRYIYDEDEYMADGFTQGKDAYYERTCGITCHTFDELLYAIENYESINMFEEIEGVYQKLWEYAGENDFEKTIQATLDFKPSNIVYPTLYTFDVFDTLISRKGLHPYSIFCKVAENMKKEGGYSEDFISRYAEIRHSAEMNVREYYRKTTQVRHSEKIEIQMHEIFDRLADVYRLNQFQARQLMEWEIEEEIDSVIPIKENIERLKKLIEKGETVVLISDMYLPKDVIVKMISNIDPDLGKLPIFVSSEYGVQKTTRLLFFEVYRSFKPFYKFGRWIHYGDNPAADKLPARRLGITPVTVPKVEFNDVEQNIIKSINNYDSYLLAAICARLRYQMKDKYVNADFVIDIIGNTLIPYVDLVLNDAISKGFEVLYFVARDGHFLKLIADSLIETKGLKIKTRYLYASRRTWRVQSYLDDIDETFWISQGGNFNDIHSKEYMLKALYIDENTFKQLIPQVDLEFIDWKEKQPGQTVASIVSKSEEYKKYLLSYAENNRELPIQYLLQELELDKKYAFVEYWGRGYNQNCMTRLLSYATGKNEVSYYYYARSILPSDNNNVRYDMTDIDTNIALFEAVFANMPYLSIEEYIEKDGIIEPVREVNPYYDRTLFDSMDVILPVMAKCYGQAEFVKTSGIARALFDFTLKYTFEHRADAIISENIGCLRDSMSMYGKIEEYAPAYAMSDLEAFSKGKARSDNTLSIQMSYGRATKKVKEKYDAMYQLEQGEDPFKSPMLRSDEIINNASFEKKYEDALLRANRCQKIYFDVCKKTKVFNKVTVLSTSKDFSNDTLFSLKKVLNDSQDIYVEWLTTSISSDKDAELMRLIAMAKYVIIDGNAVQLLKIHFRSETTCISLLDRGFRLYHFGKNENVKLKNQYRFDTLLHTRMPNVIETTSINGFENSGYTMNSDSARKLFGACVTDVLFETDYRNKALEKIHSIAPESVGKKIIVYMPTPRQRKNSGEWLELLDIESLFNQLCEEYYLLCDFRSNNALADACKNTINIPGFSKNVSKERISLRSLLVVADIVIGDYRDTFFEAALLGVPVFSTAVDMDEIQCTSLNLMYDLSEMYPFKIVHNPEELINAISNEYDFKAVNEFKSKFFVGCDGRCAERMYEMIQ